jgi:hypothetical protein
MMSRPEMYLHQRAEVRLRVKARAVIRADGRVARCPVRNLSAGGVEVYTPTVIPPVGARVELKLLASAVELGPLAAEVVRRSRYGVAFRFLDVDEDGRRRILDAIAHM